MDWLVSYTRKISTQCVYASGWKAVCSQPPTFPALESGRLPSPALAGVGGRSTDSPPCLTFLLTNMLSSVFIVVHFS